MTITASSEIIAKARSALGANYDVAGKTDAQLRLDVVSHKLRNADDKSPEYIAAAFDIIVCTSKSPTSRQDSSAYREDAADRPITRFPGRTPEQQARSDAARDGYCYNLDPAWQSSAR